MTVALVAVGCGGRPAAEQAQDALDAGLQAHIAGDLATATAAYLECLDREPSSAPCAFNLGLIAQTQGRTGEAEGRYRQALKNDPTYGPALYNLGLLMTPQDADEALSLLHRFVEIDPDHVGGRLNLGMLLRAVGDAAGAEEQFSIARRLDPAIQVPAQASPGASTVP